MLNRLTVEAESWAESGLRKAGEEPLKPQQVRRRWCVVTSRMGGEGAARCSEHIQPEGCTPTRLTRNKTSAAPRPSSWCAGRRSAAPRCPSRETLCCVPSGVPPPKAMLSVRSRRSTSQSSQRCLMPIARGTPISFSSTALPSTSTYSQSTRPARRAIRPDRQVRAEIMDDAHVPHEQIGLAALRGRREVVDLDFGKRQPPFDAPRAVEVPPQPAAGHDAGRLTDLIVDELVPEDRAGKHVDEKRPPAPLLADHRRRASAVQRVAQLVVTGELCAAHRLAAGAAAAGVPVAGRMHVRRWRRGIERVRGRHNLFGATSAAFKASAHEHSRRKVFARPFRSISTARQKSRPQLRPGQAARTARRPDWTTARPVLRLRGAWLVATHVVERPGRWLSSLLAVSVEERRILMGPAECVNVVPRVLPTAGEVSHNGG